MLAYNAPHYPFQALEDDLAPFRETGAFTTAVSHIYGMIRCMDRGVARVLDDARARRRSRRTRSSVHQRQRAAVRRAAATCDRRASTAASPAPSCSVYEGGIRVPDGACAGPRGCAGGRQVHEMVHFTDWLPTLLAVAGVEPPRDAAARRRRRAGRCCAAKRGRRAAAALLAVEPLHAGRRVQRGDARRRLEARAPGDRRGDAGIARGLHAMDVDAKFHPEKYTEIVRDGGAGAERELVPPRRSSSTCASDPLEQHDLAAQQPERVGAHGGRADGVVRGSRRGATAASRRTAMRGGGRDVSAGRQERGRHRRRLRHRTRDRARRSRRRARASSCSSATKRAGAETVDARSTARAAWRRVVACDVSDAASVEAAFARVARRRAASTSWSTTPASRTSAPSRARREADLDRIYAVNVKGVFLCSQAARAAHGAKRAAASSSTSRRSRR